MAKIDVNGVAVTVVKVDSEDYISLTDMMRSKDGEFFSITGSATGIP